MPRHLKKNIILTEIASHLLLGPLGMNHGTTAPMKTQNMVMIGRATVNDVFTMLLTPALSSYRVEIGRRRRNWSCDNCFTGCDDI